MGPIGHQRIAQRFRVTTTPIRWMVPKRRGLNARSKPVLGEAAIIELSVMGAAIVAPLKWRAVVGSKVEVHWEDLRGLVVIRRESPLPGSATLAMYGVEYAENGSPLGKALFERLVVEAGAAARAQAAADQAAVDVAEREASANQGGPALWAAPNTWRAGADSR